MKNKRLMILSIILNVILLIVVYNFATNNVKISNSTYKIKEMNESTQVTDLNNQINSLNTEHTDYMNYIQTCKNQIASALTNEGVATSNQSTLETMAENILKVLQARTSDATATSEDIQEGKTAWVNGELIIGNAYLKNNIKFNTIENPVGTTILNYNKINRLENSITMTLDERLDYGSSEYADYMCYAYPVDFTNVSTITLYQWNYISMHYTLSLALSDSPLYSRQDIIDNALETWTCSASGTTSSSNYITKNIDVSEINGVKYICIAVVSKNNSSDAYYKLTNNIISFN